MDEYEAMEMGIGEAQENERSLGEARKSYPSLEQRSGVAMGGPLSFLKGSGFLEILA